MKDIADIVKEENPSIEDLMSCFEQIKENGDVALIKFDGERDKNHYTILISFPNDEKMDMIRVDENNLISAFLKILNMYLKSSCR